MATLAALWHGPASPLVQTPIYEVSIASTLADVRACQRLRYEVFNCELGEGLESSHSQRLDRDKFDVICDHLTVRETVSRQVVGTYRMQTGYRAKGNAGYYSEEFFEFTPYECIRGQILELGRACVHRDHRDSTVLLLLWKGILRYAQSTGARYLLGCSSLTSQDPAEGNALYRQLQRDCLAPCAFRTVPHLRHRVPQTRDEGAEVKPPKLLRTYLELSAKICGPPAIDRDFKTIDFLTLLDLNKVPTSLMKRLLGQHS